MCWSFIPSGTGRRDRNEQHARFLSADVMGHCGFGNEHVAGCQPVFSPADGKRHTPEQALDRERPVDGVVLHWASCVQRNHSDSKWSCLSQTAFRPLALARADALEQSRHLAEHGQFVYLSFHGTELRCAFLLLCHTRASLSRGISPRNGGPVHVRARSAPPAAELPSNTPSHA